MSNLRTSRVEQHASKTSMSLVGVARKVMFLKGSHRLEKYLNIQDCLEKSLKIKIVLKNTQRP